MQNKNKAPLPISTSQNFCKESRTILRMFGRVSKDFNLIEEGDKILLALSGGKDSYSLFWAMHHIKRRVPFDFDFIVLNIDQGFGGFDQARIDNYLKDQDINYELVREQTGDICKLKIGENDNACWLCARLRRGILYSHAKRLGCNKLALGHHADDIVETLLMNLFYSGQLKAMPPRVRSMDKELVLIRPLSYVYEKTLVQFAQKMRFPVIDCNCNYSAGMNDAKRAETKELINKLSKNIPDLRQHIMASMTRVRPSHLLDRDLFSFDD